jgi:hypothetical protein
VKPRRAGPGPGRGGAAWLAVLLCAAMAGGCDVNKALERLSEARHLAADLHVQFSRAADASSRAVMADTDEASVAFAREAVQAKEAIQKDAAALKPVLQTLGYADETRLLEEFDRRFAAYRALDDTILELAVENTNLKAQRLSFGAGQQEADAFRDALGSVPAAGANGWKVKALTASALASVREIQALQAPHIADLDDAAMTLLEKRITGAEASARSALASLGSVVPRAALGASTAALDRFMAVNAQVMALSRRNTNVRSLVLSLNEKTKLTAACEESLNALRSSLAKHGYNSSRYDRNSAGRPGRRDGPHERGGRA